MKTIATYLVCLAAVFLFSGCVSGSKYSEFSKSLAPVSSEQGRIIIYRKWKFIAFGVLPPVKLNGENIGDSTPGGFFYVDLPPGQYTISLGIFVKQSLSMTLEKGQTRYVRLVDSELVNGVLTTFAKTIPQLVEPAIGESEIQDCSYTGKHPSK